MQITCTHRSLPLPVLGPVFLDTRGWGPDYGQWLEEMWAEPSVDRWLRRPCEDDTVWEDGWWLAPAHHLSFGQRSRMTEEIWTAYRQLVLDHPQPTPQCHRVSRTSATVGPRLCIHRPGLVVDRELEVLQISAQHPCQIEVPPLLLVVWGEPSLPDQVYRASAVIKTGAGAGIYQAPVVIWMTDRARHPIQFQCEHLVIGGLRRGELAHQLPSPTNWQCRLLTLSYARSNFQDYRPEGDRWAETTGEEVTLAACWWWEEDPLPTDLLAASRHVQAPGYHPVLHDDRERIHLYRRSRAKSARSATTD